MSVGNKLYKTKLIKNIKFNKKMVNAEDFNFNIDCLENTKRVKLVDYIGYNYKIISGQFKYRKGSIENHIYVATKFKNMLINKNVNDNNKIDYYFYNSVFYDLLAIIKTKSLTKEEKKKIFNDLKKKKLFDKFIIPDMISIKKKIFFNLYKISSNLAFFIMNIKK